MLPKTWSLSYSIRMRFALIVLVAMTFLELLLWVPAFWRFRKVLAATASVGLASSGVALVFLHPVFATILIFVVMLYRIFNLFRIVKDRMQRQYLARVVSRTGAFLIGLQMLVGASWYACLLFNVRSATFWFVFSIAQFLGIVIIVASTERHLRKTRPQQQINSLSNKALPTLTVAIPARDETDSLQECLASLVASDYPKLEILVLDDCSQNKRTPEIIRSFAQSGVRFLSGKPIKENWLPKNQAYQQLLDEANGEYVLFAGVDCRVEPDSLRHLVEAALQKKKSMVSIIPSNSLLRTEGSKESVLLQPARYAWELSLPRKMFNRPPVLSTCWIISRKFLLSTGGFAAVSRSVVPESYFARVSSVHDGYSFMQSNEYIGIKSMKDAPAQWATAVRTRYPQLHRRPELVLLMTVAELFGFIMPFLFIPIYLVKDLHSFMSLLVVVNCLLIMYFYGRVVNLTFRSFTLYGYIAAPFAAVADIIVLNYSMVRYEFSEVIWKGRNVCLPVMHAYPSNPKQ